MFAVQSDSSNRRVLAAWRIMPAASHPSGLSVYARPELRSQVAIRVAIYRCADGRKAVARPHRQPSRAPSAMFDHFCIIWRRCTSYSTLLL